MMNYFRLGFVIRRTHTAASLSSDDLQLLLLLPLLLAAVAQYSISAACLKQLIYFIYIQRPQLDNGRHTAHPSTASVPITY